MAPDTSLALPPRAEPGRASETARLSHIDLATQKSCLRFTTVLLGVCLFLQRFGLPVTDQDFSAVGPIGLAVAGWGLARGTLVLDRTRSAVFLGLVGLAMLGVAWHDMQPNPFNAAPSSTSLIQFLALTGFATLSFAAEVDELAFFACVNRLLTIVAVAGLAQFALQFVGVRIFAFGDFLPMRWLIESGYNLAIPVGVGEVLKSNGFFLVEPSVFSQFMAVALIIEVVSFRRPVQLGLFVGGLLLSFSGTGWMVLASFLAVGGLRLGPRGVKLIALSTAVLLGAGAAMVFLAPDFAGALTARLGEVSQPGTSGHMRFVTPFWLMSDVLTHEPSALFAGIGAGVSERLSFPYAYNVNTPIKVFLEFGLPLLLAYLALFAVARRTPAQGALFVPCMLLFLFTGGYQQFPPVLFPILLLVAVARLHPARTKVKRYDALQQAVAV